MRETYVSQIEMMRDSFTTQGELISAWTDQVTNLNHTVSNHTQQFLLLVGALSEMKDAIHKFQYTQDSRKGTGNLS